MKQQPEHDKSEERSVSIVVPVYNSKHNLATCLDSIFNLDYPNYEVIVVDDASDDGSADIAQTFGCKLVSLAERSGAGIARMQGVMAASGEIIAFIDSDCVVSPDYLTIISRHLTKNVGGVGGTYKPFGAMGTMALYFTDLCDYYFIQKMLKGTDFLPGGCCAFWRDVLLEERPRKDLIHYRNMASGEDVMMCYEISRRHPLVFTLDLSVRHVPPGFRRFLKQQANWGFSRTITSFLLLKDKFFKAKDTRMAEQAIQVLFLPLAAALAASGAWKSAAVCAGLYLAALAPFLWYIQKKDRHTIFTVKAFFLTGIRNVCLFAGLLKGLIYLAIIFRLKRPPHAHTVDNPPHVH